MSYEGNIGALRRLGAWGFGQTTGRAGPNQAGGLTTSYSNNLVFNPDQFDIVYNVAFGIGRPQGLPSQYVPPSQLGLPTAVATWIWDPKNGPTSWPGTGAPPSNASVSSKNISSLVPTPTVTIPTFTTTPTPMAPPTITTLPTSTTSLSCPAGFILDPTGTTCIPTTSAAATNLLTTPSLATPQIISPTTPASSSKALVLVIATGALLLGIILFLKERKSKAATPARKK